MDTERAPRAREVKVSVHHYIAPVFRFEHPEGGPPQRFVILNGKAMMPPWLRAYEGAVSLFGGKAEEGEDRLDTLRRELSEELPSLRGALDARAGWADHEPVSSRGDLYRYTVTAVDCGVWSQEIYQELAATCGEGYVLPCDLEYLDRLTWVTMQISDNVRAAVAKLEE